MIDTKNDTSNSTPIVPLGPEFHIGAYHGFLGILGVYVVIIVGVGLLGKLRPKENFGGSFGILLLTLSLFSSLFSGYILIGIPGEAYRDGFSVLRWLVGWHFFQIIWIISAPRIYIFSQKFKWVSPTDLIKWRFNNQWLSYLTTITLSVPLTICVVAQFTAIISTTNGITNGQIPGFYGALLFGFILLIYEGLGGLRDVVYVDVVQVFLMIISFGAFIVIGITEYGGMLESVEQMMREYPEKTSGLNMWENKDFLGFSLVLSLSMGNYGPSIQRMYSALNKNTLFISLSITLFLPLLGLIPPMSMGWLQFIKDPTYPGPGAADETFSVIVKNLLLKEDIISYFIASTIMAFSFATIMSTIDAALVSFILVIFVDFVQPHTSCAESTYFILGKVLSAFFVMVCVSIAIFIRVPLSTLFIYQNSILLQLVPLYLCSLFSKTTYWLSPFIGLISSWITFITLLACGIPSGILALVVNILVTGIMSLIVKYYLKINLMFTYPEEYLPLSEPWEFKWCIILWITIGLFAVPWYIAPGAITIPILGFPLWGFVILVICLLLAFFGFFVMKVFWKERPEEYEPIQNGVLYVPGDVSADPASRTTSFSVSEYEF